MRPLRGGPQNKSGWVRCNWPSGSCIECNKRARLSDCQWLHCPIGLSAPCRRRFVSIYDMAEVDGNGTDLVRAVVNTHRLLSTYSPLRSAATASRARMSQTDDVEPYTAPGKHNVFLVLVKCTRISLNAMNLHFREMLGLYAAYTKCTLCSKNTTQPIYAVFFCSVFSIILW